MRTLVVIPTYQEGENVERLLRRLRSVAPEVDLLVVDDDSPDGTADRAEDLGRKLGGIDVLRRPAKAGLGTAYRDGFSRGIESGYDLLVSMDADFSHDPAALHSLLTAVEAGAALAIGSRYVPGGSIPDWPWHRRLLSRAGNGYASVMLGVGVSDMTSGYRAYRAEAVRGIYDTPLRTRGYGALIEMAYRVASSGGRVAEVPITFVDRRRGQSKMSATIAFETLWQVTYLGIRSRLSSVSRPSGPTKGEAVPPRQAT